MPSIDPWSFYISDNPGEFRLPSPQRGEREQKLEKVQQVNAIDSNMKYFADWIA